jgi:DNA repair protein RadC
MFQAILSAAARTSHPPRPRGCNLVELFATLIGGPRQVETAEALFQHFKTLTTLRQAHTEEIASLVPGVGRTTATRLVAALELGLRLAVEPLDDRPVIHSPADAAALIQAEMSAFERRMGTSANSCG